MKTLILYFSIFIYSISSISAQINKDLPDTGISGVYEVMLGVENAEYAIKYFAEFGFTVIDSSVLSASESMRIYGVDSKLNSYRLQNGNIDSHGLLRLLNWENPISHGVGYAPPETIGQRMSVMRTLDIFRLDDIYNSARENGEKWLATKPIADDLFDLDNGKKSFFNKPVIVRENGVYGEFFNHIFFQRYGYNIPGYGTIGKHSNLKTSEFTHHDFIITANDMSEMSYLSTALGLKAEKEPEIDGDWLKGPKRVFQMAPGDSHWYQGFVSPNNICGKLKFFIPTTPKANRTSEQKIGALGITLHSFYTDKLDYVFQLVKEHNFKSIEISKNEFSERSFVFYGAGGCNWQIIEKNETKNIPTTELKFELTKN